MDNTAAFNQDLSEDDDRDTHYDAQRDSELLEALHDTTQYPPPGLIRYSDLTWIPHRTQGNGTSNDSEIATIPWARLEDFVEGQKQDPHFPANFKRHVRKRNEPGSLARARASSAAQVIR